jgi:hypothetical protein
MVINEHDPGLALGSPLMNQDIPGVKVAVAASRAVQPGNLASNLPENLKPFRISGTLLTEPLLNAPGI